MFVFLLPYVCASLWGHVGEETEKLRQDGGVSRQAEEDSAYRIQVKMDWGVWEIPMEEFLVHKLRAVMPEDYETEALKAQAVLLRTELVQAAGEQGDGSLLLSGEGMGKWYEDDVNAEAFQVWRRAVEETEGLYLCFQGEPVQASYFQVSNGMTRDAGEVWHTEERPYLRSVSCVQDKAAQDYSSTVRVPRTEYLQALQGRLGEEYLPQELWEAAELTYDAAGYVTAVTFSVQGKEQAQMDGETFRYLFGLPSASFEMEREERQVVFHVTGVGHGFGMSQYGANCMALNGKTYDEILQEFFYRTELAKFE